MKTIKHKKYFEGLTSQGYKYHTKIYEIDRLQVNICKQWINKNLEQSKTISKYDSYYFKHRVEESTITNVNRDYTYISNGAFILACIELGFLVVPNGLNARVFLKYKKIKCRRLML